MKKTLLLIGLFVGIILWQGISIAAVYNLDDTTIYWDSWENGTADDIHDLIGSAPDFPSFNSIEVNTNSSGYLESVNITYNNYDWQVWMGDLFIDTNGDTFWDYVIEPDRSTDTATVYEVLGSYSANKADYTVAAYDTYSNPTTYMDTAGYGYYVTEKYYLGTYRREDHPVNAVNLSNTTLFTNLGDAAYQPYDSDTSTPVSFYDLVAYNIPVGSGTVFAIAPNCANDVLKESVPEPATVLIVGFGLLGLGLCSNSKMRKNK